MVDLRKSRIHGPTAKPNIADVLNRLKREIMLSMNCTQVGTIKSFDSTMGTARIAINVKRKLIDGSELDYPVLEDVPCFFLFGGTSKITLPITAGDTCLVIFADRSFDDWYLSGEVKAPNSTRCHSLSDGIAIVGLKSLKDVSLTPMDSICINGGSKKVSVKNDEADLKTQLDEIINQAMDAITATREIITQTKKFLDSYKTLKVNVPTDGTVPSGGGSVQYLTSLGVCTLSPEPSTSAAEANFTAADSDLSDAYDLLDDAKTELDSLLDEGMT